MAAMLLTAWGSVVVALLMTLIVCVETRWLPWSPFFLIYAVLALALPLGLGAYAFGDVGRLWEDHAGTLLAWSAAILVWENGIATWFYERVFLSWLGKRGDPAFSPTHALEALTLEAGQGKGLGLRGAQNVFGIYSLLWAPLAEELFYWGYLFSTLRKQGVSLAAATAVTSIFFGIRHAIHFLYLGKRFPWAAAAWLSASTAVTALLNCLLFETTQSLYPLIALHFLSNALFAVQFRPAVTPG